MFLNSPDAAKKLVTSVAEIGTIVIRKYFGNNALKNCKGYKLFLSKLNKEMGRAAMEAYF